MKTYKLKNKILNVSVVLIVSILIGIGIQSCNEESVTYQLSIPEEYNEVGKLHNEGLDFVFGEIKAQAIEAAKKPSPEIKTLSLSQDSYEFFQQATLNFCKKNNKLNKHIAACEEILTKSFSTGISTKSLQKNDSFSPELQYLLDATYGVLQGKFKKAEISELKAQLDAINQKAAQTLPEADAAVIYSATSTGYNSYQYWIENYKKWYFALHYPEILEQYNDAQLNQLQIKNGSLNTVSTRSVWSNLWNTVENWWYSVTNAVDYWWDNGGSDIVTADAAGAGGGAATGAITGAGAIPGAIAGGLSGSIKEAIETYLDAWWENND